MDRETTNSKNNVFKNIRGVSFSYIEREEVHKERERHNDPKWVKGSPLTRYMEETCFLPCLDSTLNYHPLCD